MTNLKQNSNGPKKKVIKFQTVRGMRDILPDDQPYWNKIEKQLIKLLLIITIIELIRLLWKWLIFLNEQLGREQMS